jgi:hypothetical protein
MRRRETRGKSVSHLSDPGAHHRQLFIHKLVLRLELELLIKTRQLRDIERLTPPSGSAASVFES